MLFTLVLLLVFLTIVYAAGIIYYRVAWLSIPDFKSEFEAFIPSTSVTLIVPARNEAANIESCLRALAEQQYPKHLFEILVVNDHSTDTTASIVKQYENQNIRLINLADHIGDVQLNAYKKKAIETGIQLSNGKLIVTTDADCTMGKLWLHTIVHCYEKNNAAFIAAPVAIKYRFSFLQIFQALDFLSLQGITGAAVHRKIHNMCNGANLAYEKTAFTKVEGFKGIDNIASGDDMLLMHKIAEQYKDRIVFLKSQDAIVQTKAEKSIVAFLNQRIRWASKADKYKDASILPVLMIVFFLNLLLLIIPFVALSGNQELSIGHWSLTVINLWLIAVAAKTVIELYFLFPVAKFFSMQQLLWWFPIMQPFHWLYTVIAGFLGKFSRYEWKERKVK